MKKFYKIAALVLSVVVLLGMFVGCGDAKQIIKIGVIQFATHSSLDNCYTGLVEGLKAKGYTNNDKVIIDFQNAQGQPETADQLAKNMVSKNYDMIVGIATPAAVSAYSAARGTDVPVVFCAVSDPVSAQLVTSLDAPGGNCTGTSDILNLDAQLKMIRAYQPEAKKIGILYTTSEANSVSHLEQIKELAPHYGFEIVEQGVQSPADIAQAAASLVTKVDCINNFTDNNVVDNLSVVLSKANEARIPIYGSEIEQVKNGCLASESLDYIALGKATGEIAAKILAGEKAATVPVSLIKDSQPCVNTDVLSAFGLSVPAGYESSEKVTISIN